METGRPGRTDLAGFLTGRQGKTGRAEVMETDRQDRIIGKAAIMETVHRAKTGRVVAMEIGRLGRTTGKAATFLTANLGRTDQPVEAVGVEAHPVGSINPRPKRLRRINPNVCKTWRPAKPSKRIVIHLVMPPQTGVRAVRVKHLGLQGRQTYCL